MSNKTRNILIWGGFAILIMALCYFVFFNKNKDPESFLQVGFTEEEKPSALKAVTKTISEENRENTVSISYPEISGIDIGSAKLVNSSISKKISFMISEFKNGSRGAMSYEGSEKSSLSLEYSINTPTHGVLSILFYVSEYMSGAAHPNTFVVALNYDLVSGKEVSLKNIFKGREDYLVLARDLVRPALLEKIKDGNYDKDWVMDGTEANEENYSVFSIRQDSLVILFNPYQVGPYALGIVEVPILLSQISSDIDLDIIKNLQN